MRKEMGSMLNDEEINQAYARGVHENGCFCVQTYGIDHCAAGAKALAAEVRAETIRECVAFAKERAAKQRAYGFGSDIVWADAVDDFAAELAERT